MNMLDAIMEVMDAAFDPHWGEAWSRAQIIGSLTLPATHCLLIDPSGDPWMENSEPAAFLLSRQAPGEEELLLVAVKPHYRREGLGAALLDQFIAEAASRGAENIFLEMRENNPAISLYKQFGFAPIGRRKNYYSLADGTKLDAITFGRPQI